MSSRKPPRLPFNRQELSFLNETLAPSFNEESCLEFNKLLNEDQEIALFDESIGMEGFDITQLENRDETNCLKASSNTIGQLSPVLAAKIPLPPPEIIEESILEVAEESTGPQGLAEGAEYDSMFISHVEIEASKKVSKTVTPLELNLPTAPPPSPPLSTHKSTLHINPPSTSIRDDLAAAPKKKLNTIKPPSIQVLPAISSISNTTSDNNDLFKRRKRDSYGTIGREISFEFGTGRMAMESTPRPGLKSVGLDLSDLSNISVIKEARFAPEESLIEIQRKEVEQVVTKQKKVVINSVMEKKTAVRVEVPEIRSRDSENVIPRPVPLRASRAAIMTKTLLRPDGEMKVGGPSKSNYVPLRASRVAIALATNPPIKFPSTLQLPAQPLRVSAARRVPLPNPTIEKIDKVPPKLKDTTRRTLTLPQGFTLGQSTSIHSTLAKKRKIQDENQRLVDEEEAKKKMRISNWGKSTGRVRDAKGKGKEVEIPRLTLAALRQNSAEREEDVRIERVAGFLEGLEDFEGPRIINHIEGNHHKVRAPSGWSQELMSELESGSIHKEQIKVQHEEEREKLRRLKMGLKMIDDEIRLR